MDEQIWDIIKFIIATLTGFFLSFLPQWIKSLNEETKTKKKFIELYNAFRSSNIFTIFRVFKSIKMERIEKVLNGLGQIWYEAEKKEIKGNIDGTALEQKHIPYDDSIPFEEHRKKERENRTIDIHHKYSTRSHQYVLEKSYESLFIRFDMYDRYLFLKPVGKSCVLSPNNKPEQYNFFDQDKNPEILIEFLEYLENQYKIHNIIKDKETLSKEIEINPNWNKN